MKQFVDKLFSYRRLELVKEVARSVRETATESQNLLKFVGWNELNGVHGRCCGGGRLPRDRRGGCKTVLGIGEPHRDFRRWSVRVGNRLRRARNWSGCRWLCDARGHSTQRHRR